MPMLLNTKATWFDSPSWLFLHPTLPVSFYLTLGSSFIPAFSLSHCFSFSSVFFLPILPSSLFALGLSQMMVRVLKYARRCSSPATSGRKKSMRSRKEVPNRYKSYISGYVRFCHPHNPLTFGVKHTQPRKHQYVYKNKQESKHKCI